MTEPHTGQTSIPAEQPGALPPPPPLDPRVKRPEPPAAAPPQKSQGTWTCLVQVLVVIAIIFVVAAKGRSPRDALEILGVMAPVVLAVAAVLIAVWFWCACKLIRANLQKMPPEYQPEERADATLEFPVEDLTQFRTNDAAFRKLGFMHVTDTREYMADGSLAFGFQRIYWHPEMHCFARVSFGRMDDYTYINAYSVESYFADDWWLGCGSFMPLGLMTGASLPRALAIYRPGATPNDLVAHHCRVRDHLVRHAHLHVLTELDYPVFLERCKRASIQGHALRMQRGYARLCITAIIRHFFPRKVWLGELEGKVGKLPR